MAGKKKPTWTYTETSSDPHYSDPIHKQRWSIDLQWRRADMCVNISTNAFVEDAFVNMFTESRQSIWAECNCKCQSTGKSGTDVNWKWTEKEKIEMNWALHENRPQHFT